MADKMENSTVETVVQTVSNPTVLADCTLENKPKPKRRGGCNRWRLNMLAAPKNFTSKYQKPEYTIKSGVTPTALNPPLNERIEHLARANLRSLYINKHSFSGNPNTFKDFDARMDKHLDKAWNSIYNEYKKAKRDKQVQYEIDSYVPGTVNNSFVISEEARRPERKSSSSNSSKNGKAKTVSSSKKEKSTKKGTRFDKPEKGKRAAKLEEDTVVSLNPEDVRKQVQEWVNKRVKPKRVFQPDPLRVSSNMNISYKYEF